MLGYPTAVRTVAAHRLRCEFVRARQQHMATQDMQLKWRASFGEAEDAPVGGE